MPKFGKTSRARLETCHADLQLIFNKIIKEIDCTIIEGHRDEERQNEMVHDGKSQLSWPDSNHNSIPSMAVDAAIYHEDRPHIHWSDDQEFWTFANIVRSVAQELYDDGIIDHLVRWGGDWDDDGKPTYMDDDETFWDAPHFELYKPEA